MENINIGDRECISAGCCTNEYEIPCNEYCQRPCHSVSQSSTPVAGDIILAYINNMLLKLGVSPCLINYN